MQSIIYLEPNQMYSQQQNKWHPQRCLLAHFEATFYLAVANLLSHNNKTISYGQVPPPLAQWGVLFILLLTVPHVSCSTCVSFEYPAIKSVCNLFSQTVRKKMFCCYCDLIVCIPYNRIEYIWKSFFFFLKDVTLACTKRDL